MKNKKLDHIKSKKTGFKIPEGYFDTMEDTVFAKITTEKFVEKEGFIHPEGYFDTLEDNVFAKIDSEKEAFSYPKGYFDTVEDSVFTKIREEKFANDTGFGVPDNYLGNIEESVIAKLGKENKTVKVIDLKSILLRKVLPIAAAASLALFIFLNYQNNSDPLAQVDSLDVEQWIDDELLTFDADEIAEVYSDVALEDENAFSEEDEELLEYLDGTDIESMLLEN